MKPWQADTTVSPEQAKELIEAQCPGFREITTIEPFGEGWDNTAYLVNKTYVFRFPRREIARELMQTEIKLLPQIAGKLSLLVPNLEFIGNNFAGYQILEGQTACRARLSREERCKLAEPLAHFLKALHSFTLDVPGDKLERLDIELRRAKTRDNLVQIKALGLLDDTEALTQWVEGFPVDVRVSNQQKVLCHGDLYARHLLVNDKRELCGVIDWGDAHLGDPAVDLSLMFAFLPPEARGVFSAVYGVTDFNREKLARLRALFSLTTLLVYGHDIADEDLIWEAHQGLSWFLKVPKVVVDYDPSWPEQYEDEARKLKALWRDDLIEIHHFGSTSVPSLDAKPIIDIMLVVPSINVCDKYSQDMAKLGYEPKGAYVHEKHRIFVNNRKFHVHVFEQGDPEIEANLNFRDRLRERPELAQEYASLKVELAKKYPWSSAQYRSGKNAFIKMNRLS